MGSGSSRKQQRTKTRRDSIESVAQSVQIEDISPIQDKRTTYIPSRTDRVRTADNELETRRTSSKNVSQAHRVTNFCDECPHCRGQSLIMSSKTPIERQPVWVMKNTKDLGDGHIFMDEYDEVAVKNDESRLSHRHEYLPTVVFPSTRTNGAMSTNYYRSSMVAAQNQSRYTPSHTPY